ncbi:hypothetical protein [Paraburkholderia terrae]|uniref:hypothetical protein n=1 Tax=Paraburkholderia terrae TaxID=311230 RepID=UPI00205D6174|nr:hypothetical protein [Paraburkholderia terrae]BDC45393.1 hypothetical protein PTKU15_86900 [Paraburkholderia terrae]
MERDIFVLMERAISSMQSYIERGYVLAVGLSGGKDSTCAMVLMLEAARRSRQAKPDVKHYITSADTTIDNPSTANFLHSLLEEVTMFVDDAGLPVEYTSPSPRLHRNLWCRRSVAELWSEHLKMEFATESA